MVRFCENIVIVRKKLSVLHNRDFFILFFFFFHGGKVHDLARVTKILHIF